MAFTAEQNQAIRDYVAANINNPAAIAAAAAQFGVTANDLANAVGTSTEEVNAYFAKADVAPPPTVAPVSEPAAPAPVAAPLAPAASTAADLMQQLLQYSPEGTFSGGAYGGREGQVSQLANMLFNSGITDINQFGVRAVPIDPENPSAGLRPEYYNKATDQPLQSYNGLKYVADVAARYDPNITAGTWQNVVPGQNLAFGQTWEGPGSTTFNVMFDAQGRPIFNTYGNSTNDWDALPNAAKLAILAGGGYLAAPAIGGALASAAPGTLAAGTAANAAATGALLGGGTAAITGNDILKGALLGGLGGYAGNQLFGGGDVAGISDADIAAGMVPEFGTNAAYDAFMRQAMTPAAQAAIEAQIANSSVAGMTPQEILAQGGMITDMAAGTFIGPQTAEQLGQGFQEYMAQGGYTPVQLPSGTTATVGGVSQSSTPSVTPSTPAATSPTTPVAGGLTTSQITNLIKAGIGLAGVGAAGGMLGGGGGSMGIGDIPTQGVPQYGPDYYQAVQQYYNAYMPEMPRDVATPLQQWYETKYGA